MTQRQSKKNQTLSWQASLKLGEAMYKAQGAAAGAGNAQGAEQGAPEAEPKKDDNVVDADFEEVK